MYLFMYLFIYLFEREREREEERDKEWEKNINVPEKYPPGAYHVPLTKALATTEACVLTGNQTGDLPVHRPALSPLSHTNQRPILQILKN